MPDNARRMYVTIHCRDDDRWSANVDTRDPTDVPKCATVILSRTQCHSWLSTVYGLYNKSTKVAVVLGLMLLARIILCSTTRLYAGSFVMLNGNCKLPNAPSVVLFLGQVTFLLVRASNNTTLSIFCLANLVILLSIIQIKCKTLGGHPIYRIIARDTAWVLCVLIRTFWSCSAKKKMVKLDSVRRYWVTWRGKEQEIHASSSWVCSFVLSDICLLWDVPPRSPTVVGLSVTVRNMPLLEWLALMIYSLADVQANFEHASFVKYERGRNKLGSWYTYRIGWNADR